MAMRFIIDAVPINMSITVHTRDSVSPSTHMGPVSRYAAHTGIENSATQRSLHAKDTTK